MLAKPTSLRHERVPIQPDGGLQNETRVGFRSTGKNIQKDRSSGETGIVPSAAKADLMVMP